MPQSGLSWTTICLMLLAWSSVDVSERQPHLSFLDKAACTSVQCYNGLDAPIKWPDCRQSGYCGLGLLILGSQSLSQPSLNKTLAVRQPPPAGLCRQTERLLSKKGLDGCVLTCCQGSQGRTGWPAWPRESLQASLRRCAAHHPESNYCAMYCWGLDCLDSSACCPGFSCWQQAAVSKPVKSIIMPGIM